MTRAFFVFAITLECLAADCVAIDADRVVAGDLARAEPAFNALPADAVIGLAPSAGIKRVFVSAELARIAQRHGAGGQPFREVCVERTIQHLTETGLQPILERALASDKARVEIVDFSRYPVPAGQIEFALTGLARSPAAPNAPVLWRGRVRHGGSRTTSIWARVLLTQQGSWIETVRPIRAGQEIGPDDIVQRSGWSFPSIPAPLATLDEVVGRKASRSIAAAQKVFANMLRAAVDVEIGDNIVVESVSGSVTIRSEGQAKTRGRVGERVLVNMTKSKKAIEATVSGKKGVTVHADDRTHSTAGRNGDSVSRKDSRASEGPLGARPVSRAGSLPIGE